MMSNDRDKHEDDERTARQASQEISTKISVLIAQTVSTNATLFALETEQQAAQKSRDTELLKKLGPEIAAAQTQASNASKALLLALVPNVVAKMRAEAQQWYGDRDTAEMKYRNLMFHNPDQSKNGPIQEELTNLISNLNNDWSLKVKAEMITANDLRLQLLKFVPPTTQGALLTITVSRARLTI